jgi:hypothetical protein
MTIKANKHRCKHYPYANKKWYRKTGNHKVRRMLKDVSSELDDYGAYKKVYDVWWSVW